MLDIRTAQTSLENLIRDTIVLALGRRLPAVDSVSSLRDVPTRGASQGGTAMLFDDDRLIPIVSGGIVIASYRWSSVSSAPDDGQNVIQPSDTTDNGRWFLWTSPLRIAPVAGGNSFYLHELATGPVQRVIVLDRAQTTEELRALVQGAVPAIAIDAMGDTPDDEHTGMGLGYRWSTEFEFVLSVITTNLRDRREAAQGSQVAADIDPGANTIDGLVRSLLAGTQLAAVEDGVRAVRFGKGSNSESVDGQRRVVRERAYTFQVTETYPQAPNEISLAEEVDIQTHLGNPAADLSPFDQQNYLISGFDVVIPGSGLTATIHAGTAVVQGTTLSYAGTSYAFPGNGDTYRDLSPYGVLVFTSVPADMPAPVLADQYLRIGVTRTNATGIVGDRILAAVSNLYGNPIQIPLE